MQGKGLLSICLPLTLIAFWIGYFSPLSYLETLAMQLNLVGVHVFPLILSSITSMVVAIVYSLKNNETLGYRRHGALRLLLSGILLMLCAYVAPFVTYMYNSQFLSRLPLGLMQQNLKLDIYLSLFFSMTFILGSVGIYFLISVLRNLNTKRNISTLNEV
ncbi:hypothetical protein VQ643_06965 [Pseudomonas sp. F1_0610]|uniref:hypothetical protein n=1 Tax=Pseudomonas sp. F1_0610 TaxID=3114284 RepID=UPI0039C067ED